jgi:hypothetical protein
VFKYLLIIILNTPFVLFGILRSIRNYQKGLITRLRMFISMFFWLLIFVGLIFAQPLYDFLQQSGLTDSTPLSLFDVVQTTGIIVALFFVLRLYTKNDLLEYKIHQLNRELSIQEAEKKD